LHPRGKTKKITLQGANQKKKKLQGEKQNPSTLQGVINLFTHYILSEL
jgi:hypothetical protein